MRDATSTRPSRARSRTLAAVLLLAGAGTGVALWERVVAASASAIEKGWQDLYPTLGSSFEFVDFTPRELPRLRDAVPGEVLDVPWLTEAFLADPFLARTTSVATEGGVTVWKGTLEGCLFGESILVASEAGAAGFFQRDDTIYCVEPLPLRKIVITKLFHREMPEESGSVPPPAAPVAMATAVAASAPTVTRAAGEYPIEVLLLVPEASPRAPSYCGGPTKDLVERLLEERMNDAFQRSFDPSLDSDDVTFHVVMAEIDYRPAGGGLDVDLGWLTRSSEVAELRDRLQADLVGLLMDAPASAPTVGGLSTQHPTTGPDPNCAFMVIEIHSALAHFSLEHEIGHCVGMHHDAGEPDRAPFYGHMIPRGDGEPLVARTIMMGSHGQQGVPRIPVFSHPGSDSRGLVYGVAGDSNWNGGQGLEMLVDAPANNRLAILENVAGVSRYRSGHPAEQ